MFRALELSSLLLRPIKQVGGWLANPLKTIQHDLHTELKDKRHRNINNKLKHAAGGVEENYEGVQGIVRGS